MTPELEQKANASLERIDEAIEIDVPARVAYDQWTQFEDFPKFLDSVEDVKQLDERTLRWRALRSGRTREWNAEIVEQIPGKRIAWRSISGPRDAGVVTFHRLDGAHCRVMVQTEVEPDGLIESIGQAFGAERRRLRRDLKQLKVFLEARGIATGSWPGAIPAPDERAGSPPAAPLEERLDASD